MEASFRRRRQAPPRRAEIRGGAAGSRGSRCFFRTVSRRPRLDSPAGSPLDRRGFSFASRRGDTTERLALVPEGFDKADAILGAVEPTPLREAGAAHGCARVLRPPAHIHPRPACSWAQMSHPGNGIRHCNCAKRRAEFVYAERTFRALMHLSPLPPTETAGGFFLSESLGAGTFRRSEARRGPRSREQNSIGRTHDPHLRPKSNIIPPQLGAIFIRQAPFLPPSPASAIPFGPRRKTGAVFFRAGARPARAPEIRVAPDCRGDQTARRRRTPARCRARCCATVKPKREIEL
jgi:hypothetical protein